MSELPKPFQDFNKNFPRVAEAYEALAAAAHDAGPLDERARRLVKLAIAVGGRLAGAGRAPSPPDRCLWKSEAGHKRTGTRVENGTGAHENVRTGRPLHPGRRRP